MVSLLILAAVVLLGHNAFAAGNSGSTKPGWGFGDKNHIHTGPPGLSNRPSDLPNDHGHGKGHDKGNDTNKGKNDN